MDKNKQVEEMAKAIFANCNCGLFEDEAHGIAEFVIDKLEYRKAPDGVLEAIDEMKERLNKFVDNDISLHSSLPCCSMLWHFTDGIDQVATQLKKKHEVNKE